MARRHAQSFRQLWRLVAWIVTSVRSPAGDYKSSHWLAKTPAPPPLRALWEVPPPPRASPVRITSVPGDTGLLLAYNDAKRAFVCPTEVPGHIPDQRTTFPPLCFLYKST